MTATEWAFLILTGLKPGERYIYHRGNLFRDRHDETVRSLAKAVLRSYAAGQVELTQRRLGFEQYEYIAIGRKYHVRP